MKRSGLLALGLAVATLVAPGVTRADMTFILGNNPQPDEENILLGTGASGTSVTGLTNVGGVSVLFSSTTDILTEPTDGQARIAAQDGLVNNITTSVPNGSFVDLIMDPVTGTGDATVTVVANEPGGGTQIFVFTYTLGNGENFLTIVATNGETIGSVTANAPGGFMDFRQPRISGVVGPRAAVPEPSTLVFFGLGALLAGLIRRR